MFSLLFTIFVVIQVTFGSPVHYLHHYFQPRADCSFSLSHLSPTPIVVDGDYKFLYAEPDVSNVQVANDDSIIISCPGGILTIQSVKQKENTIRAKCVAGITFSQNGTNFNFNQIKCSKNPYHTARYTGNLCEENAKEIEIGFVLTNNSFAREITVCFDDINYNPLYSSYEISKSIVHHETGVSRPSFIQDRFYDDLDVSVNSLYNRNVQRAAVNTLLGLSKTSTKYIKDSSDYFLARGHLAAKADFVYGSQQTATFHYVNAAPQWQTFNGANWNNIEMDVRDYAEMKEIDVKVYTGTYGVATLPHEKTGEAIPLYFYTDTNNNKALPIPELFWKVVYNPSTQEGVAIVGVNNPYLKIDQITPICDDVSPIVSWLNFEADNLKSGFSYACTIDEFRNVVTYLPKFEVYGLLS